MTTQADRLLKHALDNENRQYGMRMPLLQKSNRLDVVHSISRRNEPFLGKYSSKLQLSQLIDHYTSNISNSVYVPKPKQFGVIGNTKFNKENCERRIAWAYDRSKSILYISDGSSGIERQIKLMKG